MKQMNRFNRKVQKIIEAFLCIASVIMLAVNLAQVLFRYIFHASILWSEELPLDKAAVPSLCDRTDTDGFPRISPVPSRIPPQSDAVLTTGCLSAKVCRTGFPCSHSSKTFSENSCPAMQPASHPDRCAPIQIPPRPDTAVHTDIFLPDLVFPAAV